jgi:parallel beta-helix repeat protein
VGYFNLTHMPTSLLKTHKGRLLSLIAIASILTLVLSSILISQNNQITELQGRFNNNIYTGGMPSSLITICGANDFSTSVFIKTPNSLGKKTPDGTYDYPYKTLTDLQTHLDGDSSLKRICVSGDFTGEIDLSNQSGSLYIKEYDVTDSSITHSGSNPSIVTVSGSVDLEIDSVDFIGSLDFNGMSDLVIEESTIDASGENYGIRILNSDSIEISDVNMTGGSESNFWSSSVNNISIQDSSFDNTNGDHNIRISSANEAIINNVNLENNGETNISFGNVNDFKLETAEFSGTVNHGILGENFENAIITEVNIPDATESAYFETGDNLEITNSTFTPDRQDAITTETVSEITIEGNAFETAKIGIHITSASGVQIMNNEMSNLLGGIQITTADEVEINENTISDSSETPIQVFNISTLSIEQNKIKNFNGTHGIEVKSSAASCLINKNEITNLNGSGVYGISLDCNDSEITNNFVTHNYVGIYLTQSTSAIQHNSFAYQSSHAIGIDTYGAGTGVYDIQNNIFYENDRIYDPSMDIYAIQSDYNLFNGTITVASGNGGSLADWQNAYSLDLNSIEDDPIFSHTLTGSSLTEDDLHIDSTSPAIDAGIDTLGIIEDIDGEVRVLFNNTPDIGADEFY